MATRSCVRSSSTGRPAPNGRSRRCGGSTRTSMATPGRAASPWTRADVLVWAKMMAYNLASNRRSELRRYRLLARGLSAERIAKLMPLYPGEQMPERALVPRITTDRYGCSHSPWL